MSSTQEIIDQATTLGKLIAEHEVTSQFKQVLQKLESDQDAQRALNDFGRHRQTLAEKEQAGRPIEVEDKHKLQSLQSALVQNPLLRELQVVEMDYADLMRRVNEAISGGPPTSAPRGAAESAIINPDLSAPRS